MSRISPGDRCPADRPRWLPVDTGFKEMGVLVPMGGRWAARALYRSDRYDGGVQSGTGGK